jgi:peroxidase
MDGWIDAQSGGPRYDVPGGRRDGTVSMASEVPDNIPAPTFNLDQLTQSFAAKGLTQEDMVTLSGTRYVTYAQCLSRSATFKRVGRCMAGAHTIGRAHCTAFSDRLYNFSATGAADPALDPPFLAQLQHACPATGPGGGVDPGLVVPMEPRTPYALDTLYYWGVLRGRGLFASDQALLASAPTAAQVRQSAYGSYPWKQKFAAAMVKMGQIQVLTGSSGQIRAKCSAVN